MPAFRLPHYTIRRVPINAGFAYRHELVSKTTNNLIEQAFSTHEQPPRWLRRRCIQLNQTALWINSLPTRS